MKIDWIHNRADYLIVGSIDGKYVATIYEPRKGQPWIVGINGYRFEYPTEEAAKADAVERLTTNTGIYLDYF